MLLLSRNSSAYLQYQHSGGEVTTKKPRESSVGHRVRTSWNTRDGRARITRAASASAGSRAGPSALFHTPSSARARFYFLLPTGLLDHGHGRHQKKGCPRPFSRPAASRRQRFINPRERSSAAFQRNGERTAAEGIVLRERKFGKLDSRTFARLLRPCDPRSSSVLDVRLKRFFPKLSLLAFSEIS